MARGEEFAQGVVDIILTELRRDARPIRQRHGCFLGFLGGFLAYFPRLGFCQAPGAFTAYFPQKAMRVFKVIQIHRFGDAFSG